MSRLILARHGRTPYNEAGRWTGLTDIDISEGGQREAVRAGLILADLTISAAFISELQRTRSTLDGILSVRDNFEPVPVVSSAALNERDYGIYTGKNKEQVRQAEGDEAFQLIRRAWNYPIEGGETLKDKHRSITRFHNQIVRPHLLADDDNGALIISSNNPLRAYVKELENIPVGEVEAIELGTAEVRVYDLGENLEIIQKTIHRIGDIH